MVELVDKLYVYVRELRVDDACVNAMVAFFTSTLTVRTEVVDVCCGVGDNEYLSVVK